MKSLLLMCALVTPVTAHPASSASFTCPKLSYSVDGSDDAVAKMLVVTVRHEPEPADTGSPGLIWIALVPPSDAGQTPPLFFTLNQRWESWEGGLYVPAGRFDEGLPAAFSINSLVDRQYIGWSIYSGHGVLTEQAQRIVAARRAILTAQRDHRIAAGTWSTSYDTDDQMKWSLVQKDAKDNGKYGLLAEVPNLICQNWGYNLNSGN